MKREQMVGSRLPLDLLKDLEMIERLEQTDRSTTVQKLLYKAVTEWKLEYFTRQYSDGKLSLDKAAQEAGVSLWEMMDYARQEKIASQYDWEEWRKDVQTVLRRVGKATAR